jgi:predicted ribonuclease toxin of YeeF-YezG toxin-antitoxin module
MPCVQPDFWQNYMDANQTQLFIGRLVPVWQHHFTSDEMDGLLKFYRSPLGQKVITEMPTTMAEANQAGQQWSHERSEQMVNELKQMGTLDTNGRCPAKVAAGTSPGAAALAGAGGAAIKATESASQEGEAKPAAKATSHSKTPAKKPAAKPAPKKTTPSHAPAKASSSKTPAKTDTKAPAKPEAKPASQPSGQGGQ